MARGARKGPLIPFGWYGGKAIHLKWLLPLLPPCRHFAEPFAGSAAVLLNRDPSLIETYNDLDGEVVNFFRVLRNQADALVHATSLSPYSREEFRLACKPPEPGMSELERARRFFVRATQVRGGMAQRASQGLWKFGRQEPEIPSYYNKVARLWKVAERLLRVQIENRDALEVLSLYDTPDTLFYCDPPYLLETRVAGSRAYKNELTVATYRQLAAVLHGLKAKVALSGYAHPLLTELFPAGRWSHYTAPPTRTSVGPTRSPRTEILITNYNTSTGERNVA